jgi:hypothetical protein
MPSPPDPRPQRPGLSQIGEATSGRLVVWNGNGQIQDIGEATVVLVSGLPTADPHVAGQLWTNSGVLTVSAG